MSPFQNHFFSRLSCYLGKHLLQFHTVHSVCSWGVEQKHAKLWGEKIESTHLLCHSFVILRIPMIALQKKSVNRSNIKNILFILLLLRICVFINVINLMSYSPAFSMICFLFLHPVLMKDRCKLFCRVAGTTAYYQLKDRVIDGTPCGPDTYDICVQGLCRVFLSVSSFMMSVHNNTHTQASTSTSA